MPSGKPNVPTKIVVHHTAARRSSNPNQFFAVNEYHKGKFGDYCLSSMGYHGGYTIFIDGDSSEWRYREDNEEQCAQKGHNTNSLSVAIAGHFDYEMPSNEQIATLKKRLRKWVDKYPSITEIEIYPHRSYGTTSCYGSLLSDEWARNLLVEPVESEKEKKIKELASAIDLLKQLVLRLQIMLGKRKK